MVARQGQVFWWIVVTMNAALGVAWAASETSRVMGSIEVAAGEHTGDLSTVNGSVKVGENAVVGRAKAVNGSIELDSHASAAEVVTVNGSIDLREGVQVAGDVHTVNGRLNVENGAEVRGDVRNVNGRIRVAAAHLGGGIETVSGSVELGPNARVDGGIHVHKDSGSQFSENPPPRVVVGPGSVIGGTLNFERPVRLYVSDRATIGPVQGATAVKFSGDQPHD
jgi:cytoskeletal protein CcmA (bactofilin family)